MLEIEHEKMENERRAKDQKIMILENKAQQLNEKLLILKMEYEEKSKSGQENEERLKEELKEINEEMLVLRKKRNELLLQDLKVKNEEHNLLTDKSKNVSSENDNRVSIQVMGTDNHSQFNDSKNSLTEQSSDCSRPKKQQSSNSITFDKTIENYNQKMYNKFKDNNDCL